MAKKENDGRINNGGKRKGATLKKEEDKKVPLMLSVKKKFIDSPEKVFKLRHAVYQFINDNYDIN